MVNFQKNHKDLIFVKADKGNIMVAANRNDYNQTLENNLLNNNLYKNVKTDLLSNAMTLFREGKIKDTWMSLSLMN